MHRLLALTLCLLACFNAPVQAQPQPSAEEVAPLQRWKSLHPRHGEIALPNGVATLQVPDQFAYFDPAETETILVEFWGNPPGAQTLGLLMPADATPFDATSWAVTINYEEEGHVSDEDAADIDYDDLLKEMRSDTAATNEHRKKEGYPPITLLGWAATPFYDSTNHKLHWAKELQFGDQSQRTLNYNIRVLGREGVLVLNFIADMPQKPTIDAQLDSVLKIAEFNAGARYEDFDPKLDQVAAYGLGALITGKVAAKSGLLATALIFAKKFGVFIVAGIGAWFGRIFKRK